MRDAPRAGFRAPARRLRGITLVEALVALAVMGFGTLAVLGVQTNLRLNAEVAKQRNEALRLAQSEIERLGGYADIATYAALASAAPAAAPAVPFSNTAYEITRQVVDARVNPDDPVRKALAVDVRWQDRTGQPQGVRLSTAVHGVPPALAGSLSVPMNTTAGTAPLGRAVPIPAPALDMGDGTSRFTPPGASFQWVFNNVTGYITQSCTGGVCTNFNARLLAGFVAFAEQGRPLDEQAELATGVGTAFGVEVLQVAPVPGTVVCFVDPTGTSRVAYYCAVPLSGGARWSGRANVTGLLLATSIADPGSMAPPTVYRVCRYTPFRAHKIVPTEMRNDQHPLDYVDVTVSLTNQNFLVIPAGNGRRPNDCPDDRPSTFIQSTTWHHQPPA